MHELNITPLLDLAFVLLVIFVITTAPLVKDVKLILPRASSHPKDPPKKPNFVSVNAEGKYFLNMEEMDLVGLFKSIATKRKEDPDLSVIIRGDGGIPYQRIIGVLEVLREANVVKVSLATDPLPPGVTPGG